MQADLSLRWRTGNTITKTRLFKHTEKFTTKKNGNFQIKILIFFYISAQNIDCGYSLEPPRRGGSNEYPQSIFLSRNKKTYTPVNPSFAILKWGLRGSKLYRRVFAMGAQHFLHECKYIKRRLRSACATA